MNKEFNATFYNNSNEYIQLAKATIEEYICFKHKPVVRGGCVICDEEHFKGEHLNPILLTKKAGVFITLSKNGVLRGCIGTITASEETLAEEIIRNSIGACSQDPRFPEVTSDELKDLNYRIDIIYEIEKVKSISELDPKKYGIIITKGYRRGIILPEQENIDSIDAQINAACIKGDISQDENPELERFKTERY